MWVLRSEQGKCEHLLIACHGPLTSKWLKFIGLFVNENYNGYNIHPQNARASVHRPSKPLLLKPK